MKSYKWNAGDYEKNSQAQQQWARKLLAQLHLNGSEEILDIGCGDGKVTAELADLVPRGSVIGIDTSEAMLQLALKNFPADRYPNLSFQKMDIRHLSFTNRFDVAFSNAALHWVKNHEPVVENLRQSLKPGGKILLQMGGKGNARYILSVLDEIMSEPDWQPYFDNFEFPYGFLGTGEYERLLSESGFTIKRIELIPKDMEQNGKSGLEGWIRTTWLPYTQRVPEEKRDLFIKTISTKYLERMPMDADGTVHVAMVRLEIEAEKK